MSFPLMELVDQLTKGFMGVTSQGRVTRETPVRTEPHPTNVGGFPRGLDYDVTPQGIGRPIDRGIHGGHIARQGDAGNPGSDGASPYQRRGFPRGLAYDVTPYGIGRPIDKGIHGGHIVRQG
jgi:hypothetical protein